MLVRIVFHLFAIVSFIPGRRLEEANETVDRHDDEDYGKTWMYFPDGEGNPQVVNLTEPSPSHSRSSNSERYINFYLYTRRNKNVYSELVLDSGENTDNEMETGPPFNDEYFDPKREVKIVTHGWQSNGYSDAVTKIKDAYLEDRECNVIIVNWERLADNYFYIISAYNTKAVGEKIAKLINYLIEEHGMSHDQFHIIGHSLGAHVSGCAGSAVKNGKVARITGLDPAKPGFEHVAYEENRLDETDAQFVDVIHTCGGVLGYSSALGDADFYPNGGTPPQPGCGGLYQMLEACSHSRAYIYFAESIHHKHGFLSKRCSNPNDVRKSSCNDVEVGEPEEKSSEVVMGDAVTFDTKGVFYLETNKEEPYARNLD